MADIDPYETKAGVRYRVRYRRPDGSSTDKRGFRTKREAKAWSEDNEVSKRRGDWVDPSLGKTTVGDLAPKWLRSKAKLADSTRNRGEYSLNQQVLPHWEHVAVGEITRGMVQDWIDGMDMSASTVSKARDVLAQILDIAVRDQMVHKNPVRDKLITMPKPEDADPIFLTVDELWRLAEAAGDAGRDIVVTLGYTGLRFGELAAAKVRRWEPDKHRLRIAESVTDVSGSLSWTPGKTRKARTVVVPDHVAEILDRHAAGKHAGEQLFTTRDGAVLRRGNVRRDWWDAAVLEVWPPSDAEVKAAKREGRSAKPSLEVTPHDLRHTAASLAIRAGANVKVIQRMLGHASAKMTLDLYGHLYDDDLTAVADRMSLMVPAHILPTGTSENVVNLDAS
ncbi:tyrosine-type recombinase/integrase [Gordonia malaquae]|uniref:tyrosine-type recombinase/integrase n=1 Tax=Gordonia malaquae TaxID=410332 RepID=UPI00301B29A4